MTGACSDHPEPIDPMFRWETSGNGYFDSLNIEMERAFYYCRSQNIKDSLLKKMDSIAVSENLSAGLEIATYWRLRNAAANEEKIDKPMRYLSTCDSTRRPYTYHRMKVVTGRLMPDVVSRYMTLKKELDWFEGHNDYLMTGTLCTYLGAMFCTSSGIQFSNALDYYEKANRAFSKGGIELYKLKNQLNLAYVGDSAAVVDSLYERLIGNSEIMNDRYFYQGLLFNLFLVNDSLPLIETNIKTLDTITSLHNELIYNWSAKSDWLTRHGRGSEGLLWARRACRDIDSTTPDEYLPEIYASLADAYRKTGQSDSALKYLSLSISWGDSIRCQHKVLEVNRAEAAFNIAQIEAEWRLRAQTLHWAIGSIALICILIALATLFFHYRRSKENEIRQLQMGNELERNRATLSATSIILQEKNNLLKHFKEVLERNTAERNITSSDVTSITRELKMHMSTDSERDSFIKTHEKLSADFKKHLKEDFPELSESQLRLAAYIAIGMSNQQIAQILNIRTDSLKVIRSRLRHKLRLETGASLEEFFRSYRR